MDMDLISAASVSNFAVTTAKRCLLVQHDFIRALLERAHVVAERALDGQPPSPDEIAGTITGIRSTVEVHLSFEENALQAILGADVPTRERRTAWFRKDHERQRDGLAILHREAMARPQLPMLAAKLAFVATWLLNEMAEEERTLSTSRD